MKDTSHVDASGEKVKATWDKMKTIIFCDLCIKEILNGNRPGTHFSKKGWIKIVNNFEKETGKAYTRTQLKNKWDLLKKEWKLWKKLKEKDPALRWNHIKGTVDASEEWWESRLKMVPEALRFRTAGIDPELEGKLDHMFRGIVASGYQACAPSLDILPSDFVEHGDNDTLEEIQEENTLDDVHILNQVGYGENSESPGIQYVPVEHVQQKRKSVEMGSSHFKAAKSKSAKQVGGDEKLPKQMNKLCSSADNMSRATSSLTLDMDSFFIQQAVKELDELSEEVPKASELYFFALELIMNKEKRAVFLSISPDIRVWWLKRKMEESSKFSSHLGT
ncbi:G2/mitotic-specific cyclin-1-like [Hibiscus syriacus]|uniref:G2/mitotic-specific cyclin-1-like n=1 Tax=Hibiscus syriacus TaxID=106335 RepID=A0A6A3AWZ4_HIBSY|nr:L10-interacting MYB domain-containing protein-like [Hibiscus syriacus]KAE8707937.1 G2/mitotic-specific cyclin-1-like [Hibiscus syriacus]